MRRLLGGSWVCNVSAARPYREGSGRMSAEEKLSRKSGVGGDGGDGGGVGGAGFLGTTCHAAHVKPGLQAHSLLSIRNWGSGAAGLLQGRPPKAVTAMLKRTGLKNKHSDTRPSRSSM